MEHTLENHIQYLNRLCRICGERSFRNQTRNKYTKERHILCKPYKQKILTYFRINIDKDVAGTHSNTMCNKCVKRIYNLNKTSTLARRDAAIACALRGDQLWTPFSEKLSVHQCPSCSHCLAQNNPVARRSSNYLSNGRHHVTPRNTHSMASSCDAKKYSLYGVIRSSSYDISK